MIEFTAPGKAVIWGEYAVLEGAPALVMAVDRYARATVDSGDDGWRITARGFTDNQALSAAELKDGTPTGAVAVVSAVLSALGDPEIPEHARLELDSTAFYRATEKLGIGSSAAVCTATCAAMATWLEQPFDYQCALTAHRILQGKAGSGLDVAAAWHGGIIRFQDGRTTPAVWPDGLHYAFLWVGHGASTIEHLGRFSEFQATGSGRTLSALCDASERLFSTPGLESLAHYAACLEEMDREAGLGIYGSAHQRLSELANPAQVVYKPCGAGGGDIGIAVSDDAAALQAFITLAAQQSFLILDLEIADHGVHRIR
jgi:phosphomevalonate kinase